MGPDKKRFAVVTGASKGLGKALATELARQRIDLILVSLPGENLPEVVRFITDTYQVEVHSFETDLSENGNVMELALWINRNFPVFILINNAGVGGSKRFSEASHQYINKMLQLNVVATSVLTHQLLPNLKEQDQSYILNVASMAAFLPCGYRTVYPASKSYVYIFSRSLYQELRGTNVFVSVVSPGVMRTNPEVTKRIDRQGILARASMMDPEVIAKYCIKRLFKKDNEIMVNGFIRTILLFIPFWIKLKVMTLVSKRELDSDL
jgi:uncharacterized protein